MTRARWILEAATSSVLLTGSACHGHPAPEEPEPAEVCAPMSPEDWARTKTQPHIDDSPEARKKLDFVLIAFLRNVERVNAGMPPLRYPKIPGVPERCIPAEVPVLVQFRGADLQPLVEAGLRAPGQKPRTDRETNLAIGVVSPARLIGLAQVPSVVGISSPRQMGLEISDSVPLIRASQLRQEWDQSLLRPYPDGAGVIVAIIDSGIDFRHQTFRKPDGRTRIIGLWDQSLSIHAGDRTRPDAIVGLPRGPVYDRHDIDHTLGYSTPPGTNPVHVRHRDHAISKFAEASHGTHVASIAAGNGRAAHFLHCNGGKYVGVAPAADIVLVNVWGGLFSDAFAAALRYVAEIADQEDKPCVVNISGGVTLGAHDGTDPLEAEVEAFMATPPGAKTRVVVKSAGNEAASRRHARAIIESQRAVTFDFEIKEGESGNCEIGFWYPANGHVNLELFAGTQSLGILVQGHPSASLAGVPVGPGLTTAHRSTVSLGWLTQGAGLNALSFQLSMLPPDAGGELFRGPWQLKVTNTGADTVVMDAWVDRFVGDVRFPAPGSPGDSVKATDLGTITIPGTAPSVVTVANHDSPGWLWGSESIHKESSRGPARVPVADYPKPTIAAPGTDIKAAEANHDGICPQWICTAWVEQTGTSMAAPHVAGALALLLQRYPTMPLAEVHDRLRTSARDPVDASDIPAWYRWGAGKLDAQALVNTPWPWVTMATPAAESARTAGGVGPASGGDRHPVTVLAGRGDSRHAALFSRHMSEVRRLVNTNRRVATLWHRAGGPALLRGLGGRSEGRSHDGDRVAYFERFLGQLTRYGSPALRASIASHVTTFVRMIFESGLPA